MHVTAPPSLTSPLTPGAPVGFSVPARHNPKLQALVTRINADDELRQLWRCANLNAAERLGLSDHGETHIRIVANASLRLLRLLVEAGQLPGLVAHPGMTREDAEVAVVLAAALHDLGLAVHYERHAEFGLGLAYHKAHALLNPLYALRERTVVAAEVLHAVVTHFDHLRCLTLEASVLKIADALDMTQGRSRSAPEVKPENARASAASIEEVALQRGEARPVRIELRMTSAEGVPYAIALLRRRLQTSTLAGLVEVIARIDNGVEKVMRSLL